MTTFVRPATAISLLEREERWRRAKARLAAAQDEKTAAVAEFIQARQALRPSEQTHWINKPENTIRTH